MTNNVNVGDMAQLAQNLLNGKTSGQDFMLSSVYNITRQAYESYPEDPVIRQFAFVIEQMADKHGDSALISQAEMTNIYNDLVRLSGNTKFRKALGMLLLDNTAPTTKTSSEEYISYNRVDASDSQLTTDDYIDQGLLGSLNGMFGGSLDEQKAYSTKVAEKGAEYVAAEIEALGFSPRVKILGGNKSTLVYTAGFDTQKGLVTVAVPIDISSNKLLLPSTFVADDMLEELTANKLSYFIDKKAYNNDFSVPNTDAILKAVGVLTNQNKTASDDDFKAKLDKFDERGELVHINSPELFTDKQNYPEPQQYIDTTPQTEMPKELAHLAQDFENDLLEAVSTFGKNAVRAGKSIVLAELAAAGFRNSQVRFGAESGNTVCYMAAIHTPKGPVEIEVPVEMHAMGANKYQPLSPSCFGYDGIVESFTSAKLQRFALNRPAPSTGQIICSTEHSYMTLPELRDDIIKSAANNDYVGCEMILGTIQERFSEEDYKNTVADYHYLLMLKGKAGQEERKCSREIQAGKGSIESRCGHFGVPMSKVVIAEDGHCQLRTSIEREKLNPIKESSASISTSKLYWS